MTFGFEKAAVSKAAQMLRGVSGDGRGDRELERMR
jgi:hypothetical protein